MNWIWKRVYLDAGPENSQRDLRRHSRAVARPRTDLAEMSTLKKEAAKLKAGLDIQTRTRTQVAFGKTWIECGLFYPRIKGVINGSSPSATWCLNPKIDSI